MKKILIATTALVATAGVAAAEVSLSGSARMGLVYDSSATDKIFIENRVRIWFNASGETDGGLGWGAKIRIQRSGNGSGAVNNASVWINGGWGKLSVGDVASGDKAVVGQVDGVGYTGLGDLNETFYLSDEDVGFADFRAAALYEYSGNGFKAAISTGQTAFATSSFGIGLGYETDTWSIAAGYGSVDDTVTSADQVTLKGTVKFGETEAMLLWQDTEFFAEDKIALSVSHTFGQVGVTAFYTSQYDDTNDFGIGFSYDLGGSATLAGGIVRDDLPGAAGSDTHADLGISFKF